MLSRLFHYLLLVGSLFFSFSGVHAVPVDFMPVICNFNQSSYSGGLQNWSVTQSADGMMFFGNQRGLLSFDGYQWNCINLPSRSVVRSVLADGKRIYVGSYTDFGYFERDAFGKYRFTSLWPSSYKSHNDEIWKIIKASNGHIYFQSFCSWFDYDGKKVTAHYDPARLPLYFFNIGSEIYVQMVNDGLYRLVGGRYVKVLERSSYGNDDIIGMISYQGVKTLCVTSKHGLFVLEKGKLSPFPTAADRELKNYQINKITMLGGSTLIVGTILNGIYAIDLNSQRLLWHYNMKNGLKNNTVLGLMTDRSNNIWATLDNGIALIHTGLPVTVMRTDQLNQSIGMVYDVGIAGNNMYVATNQALWRYDMVSRDLQQVSNSQGQNWYVSVLGHQILTGHNMSTLAVNGLSGNPLPTTHEGSTCLRPYHSNGMELLVESGYAGFRIYKKVGDKWQMSHKVKGFNSPVLEFELDNSGCIWAAHMNKGVYKLELSPDLGSVIHQEFFGAPVNDSVYSQMHVMKIRGRVVLSYQDQLYTYDDLRRKIIRYNDLGSLAEKGVITSRTVSNNLFWTAGKSSFSLLSFNGNDYRREISIPYQVFGLEVNTNGLSMYVNGQDTYFFLNNGIGRYRMGKGSTGRLQMPLRIAEVMSTDIDNRPKVLPCEGSETHKMKDDNIRFVLSYPNFNHDQLVFRYRLKGAGKEISGEQSHPRLSFQSLGYDSYQLEAEVVSADGKVLATTQYSFKRTTPFYLSVWAILVYGLLLYLSVRQYVIWRTNKIIRKNQRVAEAELLKHNLKVLEQKQIIAAQQKLIMENELSAKSKELASMAFQVAVQHNKAESLREELLEKKRKGKLSNKDFEELISNVKGGDTEETWNIFQQHFDLIHQNFFRNLRQRYPELTPTDLKFCALLRLNLSTKDIAKYTNLTVRGVEGARYRLRRKLGIKNDQSLTEFLIDLK